MDRWWTKAKCADYLDKEIFFADERQQRSIRRAKEICKTCPAKKNCLSEAVRFDMPGVFGGTTYTERQDMLALIGRNQLLSRLVSSASRTNRDIP